jgi:ferric-dicitrate binding protein FerR (iron transport regulator)
MLPSSRRAHLLVSGVFRVGDVETEALALQRYFNLHEVAHSDREIVLRR